MSAPRVLVLRAAGINCDDETVFAWRQAGAAADKLHVKRLIESPRQLDHYQVLTIPGGFSYGDDIAAGKVLANLLLNRLGDDIDRFVERGGAVLGICNGFQVLVRMGLLPGRTCPARVTITHNDSGRYEDRWVRIKASSSRCAFLDPEAEFEVPVAHGQGKVMVDGGVDGVRRLSADGLIALSYQVRGGGAPTFPENPNGSIGNVAGLTDMTGRVLGLMPHPERNIFPSHSPDRPRDTSTETAGARFFRRAVERLS